MLSRKHRFGISRRLSVEPYAKGHWNQGCGEVAEGVMISGLHIELPARIAQPDRETDSRIEAASTYTFRSHGGGIDIAGVGTPVSPPGVDRLAHGAWRNDIVFVHVGFAV